MVKPLWKKQNDSGSLLARISRFAPSSQQVDEPTLRAELFSVEQLAAHAKSIAENHQAIIRKGGNRLLMRLDENERMLRAYNRATLNVDQIRRVTPAAEWVLDNFYLIEEQIQMARRHLPRGYSRELPRLADGPSATLPRVYDLILELISHVDAQIDTEHLSAFLGAYQTVTPLNLGELWAVPIMLRLGLIENLRRITTRLTVDRQDRDLADFWAGRLQEIAETEASNLVVILAEMAQAKVPLSNAFVTEFCQRLSRLDSSVHFARNWLEQRLAEHGLSVEKCMLTDSQGQAADQVSISHTIASLRFLGSMDWRDFVEELSIVDQTLRNDPAQVYRQMDFPTRDQYRHSVEQIARHSQLSENDVAWRAIELAEASARENGRQDRAAHAGYYLIDKGQPRLEAAAKVSWPWRTQLDKAIRRFPMMFYMGGMVCLLIPASLVLLEHARDLNVHGWKFVFLALVNLVCLSQLAVSLMNWVATFMVKPRRLPRLDFSEGIPADCRAMVVVPTLLTGTGAVEHLLETLEIHYLSNRDKHLHFALLTDFRDADHETLPEDAPLVEQVSAGVELLNQKYQADRPNIFFLLHRPRRWNQAENAWMGYERKRGKLAEFNALLRGHGSERFSRIMGKLSLLSDVKFVITLDTDTQLPRDAARRLVGTIAHPLNRPQFDPRTGMVSEGYGILQPRVGVSLPSAGRSWFVRIFAGEAGIDPYTRTVSDVYQDIFNEGSFIGKGIYDVDAFERAVQGRFPENTILSHDLIESLHARSALISDVELYEEHPSRYNADINRRHRWIRGDWQIAQWLLPRIPGPDARRIANPLSALSQWKVFDNLRRSLVPAAFMLLLLGNWILLRELNGLGSLIVLAIIMLPGSLSILGEITNKPKEWPLGMHLRTTAKSLGRQFGQMALTLTFLPYDAYISLDAIARTLVRILFTRKQMLEWQTASDAERNARTDLASFYKTMWIAPVLAVATMVYLLLEQPDQLVRAVAFLIVWLCAPAIAWWISQPIVRAKPELTAKQAAFLRRIARQTWRYFETFVTARENWLPPDNFQQHPEPVIAARTSPTNMGLALLANLAAWDFGYLPVSQLIDRTRNTLATMERLERHRGHFYNWYDTRTLKPLPPNYISMVDSGNLAGHLLTLNAGLAEFPDRKIVSSQVFAGLRDTLGILHELSGNASALEPLDRALAQEPSDLPQVHAALQLLVREASKLVAVFAEASAETKWWSRSLAQSSREHLEDLVFLAPWLPVIAELAGQAGANQALSAAVREKLDQLAKIPMLREVAELNQSLGRFLTELVASSSAGKSQGLPPPWLQELLQAVAEASRNARERIRVLEALNTQTLALSNMDFGFLFDPERELFTIGYNVTELRRDASFYDLLASEARLGSYVAIAQGQIPEKHWFSLGRLLAASQGEPVLVSWSGSMFEYLMPLLVMPTYENTLIDKTYQACVQAQIDYGHTRGTPWGISESGYNLTDAQLNYQYRAFGVPGLGFKRGLAEDLVIAPYASVLALMVRPKEACENLERLAAEKRVGEYGFFEAVDYTPSRLPANETSVTIRSFMAHHQGISLLSLAYLSLDRPMQRRFLAYPPFKAEELLLQERVPKAITTLSAEDAGAAEARGLTMEVAGAMRLFTTPHTSQPEVNLLSNGRYHVVISNSGGGYSRWNELAVTRWREDAASDNWGQFCYLRDTASDEFWSAAFQPSLQLGKSYEAIFTQARAEFRQRHGAIELHAEISVSPEDDVELRRINLTNHSNVTRTIELTTYAEVVLAPAAADAAHPAFSNLFVQTEFVRSHPAILCTRRARSEGERPPWLFHLLAIQGAQSGEVSFETDRSKFVGRGRTLVSPAALEKISPLSNSAGSVLDPIVSLRCLVDIPPQETVQVGMVMGMAESRDSALALVEKYHNLRMADRLFDLAWTHSQVTLRHLGATEAEAQLYARMAGALVYANPARRAGAAVLVNNRRGQSGLWSYGISGDAPIVLLRISDADKMDMVRRLVQAHGYWRMKGLEVELVIVIEDTSVYRQSLYDGILSLIAASNESRMLDQRGGVFVRRLEQIPADDRILLQSVARLILSADKGTLDEQFQRRSAVEVEAPDLKPTRAAVLYSAPALPARELIFFNGLGGFTPDGTEYVITLQSHRQAPTEKKIPSLLRFSPWGAEKPALSRRPFSAESASEAVGGANDTLADGPEKTVAAVTPAPWVNVLANARFGTVISESGGAYTWEENSHEFRLTPWHNDPITDASGEACYLRDEETGEYWSPMPLPVRGTTPYVIRHGFGYSVFEHTEQGIASEVWVYVAKEAPVKFTLLKLRNLSGRPRRLSVISYWEWVLGDLRAKALLHVQTELDPQTKALVARNRYNTEFAERVAFADVDEANRAVTGDRKEFIGRNGNLAHPAALKKERLSGKTGAGLDPCAAIQVVLSLPDQKERELCFRLGVGRNLEEARELIRRFRSAEASRVALEEVRKFWRQTLGAVRVETPDLATNLMANGWLMYQTLSARLWARTGFYQSGGAYGFRDQLQDAMALVHTKPALLRAQIVRAAARQFREGDVQHWWHPPSGRGVRTHFSDDYLWLPYATCHYVACLNDTGILDERISFLEGRAVKPEEESYYDLPNHAEESASLYEHCVRAIENGLKFGAHGLPLMGCGDWNDGLNLVGAGGRGESVWLAFFLFDVLTQFAGLARQRGDAAFAARCLKEAELLRQNIELHAWDGQWYRRAYFDNGVPLGSQSNTECQIDSLPQSWSVITGAFDAERSRQAMKAVEQRLVRREAGLIQLFDPPFDKSPLNPGYIKGYVPGVRENGGQYTHAAIWTVMAFAQLGQVELAWELLSLINPIHHGKTPAQIATYKVEPYVIAADIYAVSPHIGRGGWTWYTGSAGWMYRLITENLLGIKLADDQLRLQPCIPKSWPMFKFHYRYRETSYHITVKQNAEIARASTKIMLDGRPLATETLPLIDDRREHHVEIEIAQQNDSLDSVTTIKTSLPKL